MNAILSLRWQNVLTIWIMVIALFLLWTTGHIAFQRFNNNG